MIVPLLGRLGRLFTVAVLVLFAGFPIYWMLDTALTPKDRLFTGQSLLLDLAQAGGMLEIFDGDAPILRWFGNSAFVAGGTTVLSLLLAVLAGYGISRYRFAGRGVLGFALFATQMLPEALIIVPLYALFATLGLLNSLTGLVLVNASFTMPVATWIVKAAMDRVPLEIEEAARVDGCHRLAILTRIVIPLVAPSIAAAAVITFFDGWNEYLFAATFISDEGKWPVSKGLSSFMGEFITPLSTVFSAALFFSIPAIIFFLLMQRRIVSGLTAGSVKG